MKFEKFVIVLLVFLIIQFIFNIGIFILGFNILNVMTKLLSDADVIVKTFT